MSLNIWLARGRKVEVGGRELLMLPLPLKKLYGMAGWLEEASIDSIKDIARDPDSGKMSPMAMVARVLNKVDLSAVCVVIFDLKDPETREPINGKLDKEFFDEYLDIPTAHKLVIAFCELNDIENIIKNLQSLPVVKKIMEAAQVTFGTPFLSSVLQSTDSAQRKLEGSHSRKSTDSSTHSTSGEQANGQTQSKRPFVQ